MLNECACGEPLVDTVRKCPGCGRPNANYRHSRWRVFWPEVDSFAGAHEGVRLGYWAAFLAASVGVIASLAGAAGGTGLAALPDAIIFAVAGVGIRRNWRSAAVVGFLLLVANILMSISRGGGVGVLTIFMFVGLLNGLRGTFAHARLARVSAEDGAA